MTEETPKTAKDSLTGQFLQGFSGNPNGRPKGVRNKLGEAFIEALHNDFAENGIKAIQTVRAEKPDQYLKVIASLMPRDLNVNFNPTDEMTDDQLIQRIRSLDTAIRPFLDAQGASGSPGGVGPETAH